MERHGHVSDHGATGGIGTAVAELLRERGHDLLLAGRSPERLDKLAAALRGGANAATQVINPGAVASPPRAAGIATIPLDLTEPRRIEAALALAGIPRGSTA